MEKWVVRNRRADFYGLAEKFHLDPLIIRLMVNRGMETEEQIETFFTEEKRTCMIPGR